MLVNTDRLHCSILRPTFVESSHIFSTMVEMYTHHLEHICVSDCIIMLICFKGCILPTLTMLMVSLESSVRRCTGLLM